MASFGLVRLGFFAECMPKVASSVRAINQFGADQVAVVVQRGANIKVPFVVGISRHTLTFLTAILQSEKFTICGLGETALAVFSYLTGGGNHRFKEVMWWQNY